MASAPPVIFCGDSMIKLIKTIDTISWLGGVLSGVMACFGVGLVICEILVRKVFGKTLYITDEYCGYLMVGLTCIALAYTLRENGHIRMTFLRSALSPKGKCLLDMFCFAIGIVFCAGLMYVTFVFFWDSFTSGSRSMQISETPLFIPQAFLPLGIGLLLMQCFSEFLKNFMMLKTGKFETIQSNADELGR
ncbi:C4-dicarboxylate transporter, small subunit [Candidatus Moduliflexus flocculans]|uniref:C4-dicarboxylate transporter, small subunit n=1 Tax=Candidatus Moduliflexus flocculans TaxID=1499966 RepID=A0A0S6W5I7_9BACT|nr:C4-dicarboxylate transporter, small subunit [Candidatus Moduliflexus flocculans]